MGISDWPRKHAICSCLCMFRAVILGGGKVSVAFYGFHCCANSQSSWLILPLGGLPSCREGRNRLIDTCGNAARQRQHGFQEEGMTEKWMRPSRLSPLRPGSSCGPAVKQEHSREGASHLPVSLQAHHPEPGRAGNSPWGGSALPTNCAHSSKGSFPMFLCQKDEARVSSS